MPRPKHFRGGWLHRRLGDGLLSPALWSPRRSKIAAGFAIGAFFSMMPMPFQMVPSALLAYFTKVNIPASIVGVWISNPVTTPIILYGQYLLGSYLLGVHRFSEIKPETWVDYLKFAPGAIMLGALIFGAVTSIIAYPLASYVWRIVVETMEKSHRNRKINSKIERREPVKRPQ